jgi:hypothetical protein
MTPHRLPSRPLTPIILGATDLALGVVLLVEPAPRVSATSFYTPRQVMPMSAWGAILLVLAVVICVRYALDRHAGYALSLAGAWHTFFVVALIGSAVSIRTAALTGICAYSCLVVMHLLAAWRKVR